jgi:hypothetical protein
VVLGWCVAVRGVARLACDRRRLTPLPLGVLQGDSVSAMIDLPNTLEELAMRRPIFHSEADFQHALAWLLHGRLPSAEIRLEVPVKPLGDASHVDLLAVHEGVPHAIELKYKTRDLTRVAQGETFSLKGQAAQDIGRYDFLKDVSRLEQILSPNPGWFGFAILLTNDSGYWNLPRSPTTVDAAFRLHHGKPLSGVLAWSPRASAGTTQGREEPLTLIGKYIASWSDYSDLHGGGYSVFRALTLDVRKGMEAA